MAAKKKTQSTAVKQAAKQVKGKGALMSKKELDKLLGMSPAKKKAAKKKTAKKKMK